jgi:hypothetical protein
VHVSTAIRIAICVRGLERRSDAVRGRSDRDDVPEEAANWGGLTGDKMTDVPFKVGDRVKKRSGYEYPGFIVSVFTNRAGAVRYVVEADHSAFSGMLHIFNGDQLEHR